MIEDILNPTIQKFIKANLNTDIAKLLLSKKTFKTVDLKPIVEQIETKKRAKKKLPTWFNSEFIYYPNRLNLEQSSSEITANYKAKLVSGDTLIDLTGGFGVDAYSFSKQMKQVTHCEINESLSEIVKHNYNVLGSKNIKCINDNGIDVLKRLNINFDWIYIDPSRRDDRKEKVFLLTDCQPNVKTFQNLFFKYSNHVLIKTSPLLDLKASLSDLKFVKNIHILAVNNEVKEVLWVMEKGFELDVCVKTVNIQNEKSQEFDFFFKNESVANSFYSLPLQYLYEPNAAILKSGAFNSISEILKIQKIHQHSHLYTSNELITFPGRRFKIEQILPFNKKAFSKAKISKANVTTRNFPISVHKIRKKLNIKDGGSIYLFFTTDRHNSKIIVICSKI